MRLIYEPSLNQLNAVSCWPGSPMTYSFCRAAVCGLHFDQTANGDAWLIGEQLFFFAHWIETKLIRASWLSSLSVCDRGCSLTTWLITSLTNLQSPRADFTLDVMCAHTDQRVSGHCRSPSSCKLEQGDGNRVRVFASHQIKLWQIKNMLYFAQFNHILEVYCTHCCTVLLC